MTDETRRKACEAVHQHDAHRHYYTGRGCNSECDCDKCVACSRVAALIEETKRETAEACAEIVLVNPRQSVLGADAIRARFGLNEKASE